MFPSHVKRRSSSRGLQRLENTGKRSKGRWRGKGGGDCNGGSSVVVQPRSYKFARHPTIRARACASLMDFRKTGVRTAARHKWYAIRHERDSDGGAAN